jgi:hypothetical protein
MMAQEEAEGVGLPTAGSTLDESEAWLARHAPGFHDLPRSDRRAIYHFSFLWSLFEAQLQGGFAKANTIRDMVDSWVNTGVLDIGPFADELAYFRRRYFADGKLTGHFPHLNLRPGDNPQIVNAVIEGASHSPRDQMLALLMIVWRLRNNLFHGAKWAYQLRDQLDNFTHANRVLMHVLDQHGNLH